MSLASSNLVQAFNQNLNICSALSEDCLFLDVTPIELNNIEVAQGFVTVNVEKVE
jgi:hypothetical protein